MPNIPEHYSLQYKDWEGDFIEVVCDTDLGILRECFAGTQEVIM